MDTPELAWAGRTVPPSEPDTGAAWVPRGQGGDGQGGDTLGLFLGRLRRQWILAITLFLFSVATATALAFLLPSYWRVEVMVMPVSKSGAGFGNLDLGSASGMLGGLGGMGGVAGLLGKSSSNEDEAMAVLGSRELFDTYATQQNLLPVLFASKWDAEAKRWTVPADEVPTLRRGFKLFNRSIRDIALDRRSGIVTLAITWKDRELAVRWARDLVALTNAQLRDRALADANRNLAYLRGAMANAQKEGNSNALNAALASAYERTLQNYMYATGQTDFAFRIIDPPTVPDARERVWPNRPLFLALGVILGALLAAAVVHLRGRALDASVAERR
ncbi:hypothetical protein [Nitrospirillum sp. BR 11828]|uniref:hypothetical protein n=1 Tax=Nitrospirillum sp. BR 11828 TaxID=3104325 RepID=UPI002ACA7184|nr:hypothetical protein [Nitrospirillum sp. BR 11828]MDZ5650109.1 hypothetical protein [Nitrospirillum sp. BR 11828]